MPRLSIALLGKAQVHLDGQPARAFAYNKARALLAYLVSEAARPHGRDEIVGLLWPDLPDTSARTNLRQALVDLREVIGDAAAPIPFLIITREAIQFNIASDYDLDVAAFTRQLDLCARHSHRHIERCPACADHLQQAALLYRGDFLAQFFVSEAAPFEEWLLLKREALHQRAVEALAQLAAHYEIWNDLPYAREMIAREIELDPWREEAHVHLMRVLLKQGQRSAALNQYEVCRRILAEQFGVEPSAEMQQLHEQIRTGQALEEATSARSFTLPIAPTKLIGRQAELRELAELVSDPAQRLITIVGPGGIGKTRLALAAATDNAPIFADGVAFVSLAGLTSSEALAATILSALEITPEPHVDPAHQLLAELRQREALLVLDNFEHLLAGVDLITQIIQHTRRAVLLITSRERLALQSERVFELEGLDYPPEEGNGDGERYSAVQLFIDRARQATRKFQPARELAPIVRICRLVEGLPLAIELAASTVNAQSCAIIAAEIANDLKFLATKFRDVPERHRSMQATFDHSWRLLTVGEQSVFRQLAVFRGGFEWGAAQQVAQATREILTTLAAKSLLRGGPSGRFELHELLRQFAAEQLSRVPAEARAVGAQHSAYYLQLLHEQVDRLSSAHQADAFDRLTAEVDNVRSAWRWAVCRHQWEGIRSSALDLMSWCDYQVYYSDGYQLFAEAIDQLQIGAVPVESLDAERASAEGQVLTGHGYFLWRMGHNERAQHDLQHGLDRLRRANDTAGLADNLIGLGAVSASLGQYEVALAHFEESAELYDQLHDRTGYALATLQTGIVNRSFGDYEAAGQQMEQALAVYRQLGDQKMVANSLCQYARLLVVRGQVEQAQRPLQEGLTISHAISDRWANSGALVALGHVEYAQGHFEEARRALAESVQELTDLNEFERMVDALIWQGLSELALGDHVVADRHLREALRLAHQGSLRRCQSGALLGLAEMQAQHEQFDCALELADCVHNHLATERSTRDRAGRLRAALTARLAPAPLKAIQRRVQDRSLDEIIDVVLKEAN